MRKSEILRKDRLDLLALQRRMKPAERLSAYLHHCELIHRIYRAGKVCRSRTGASFGKKGKTSP